MTQHQILLDHFKNVGSISGLEAITVHRIYALPRRIKDLEECGHQFIRERRRDVTGKRYVRYFYKGWKANPALQKHLDV